MTYPLQWQRAEMCLAWSRWLPCSTHLLRVVPDPHRFPRRAWEDVPEPFDWDAPVWCDPGDPDDWIADAKAGHGPGEEDIATRHAREQYDARVKIRAERIDLFTTMCRRAGMAPPSTLTQLLDCLIRFDLYRRDVIDGEVWLSPRLGRNPLDVLPLSAEEAMVEANHQQHERAGLAGAGLRRLVLADAPPGDDAETVTVTATLRSIGEHARIPAGQVRPALALLATDDIVDLNGTDLDRVDVDTPIELRLPWPHVEHVFDFEELPPPEHFP